MCSLGRVLTVLLPGQVRLIAASRRCPKAWSSLKIFGKRYGPRNFKISCLLGEESRSSGSWGLDQGSISEIDCGEGVLDFPAEEERDWTFTAMASSGQPLSH